MVLIYVVISVILLTINNEAFDFQCGSIECVQLKIFFSYLYISYEINDSVKFFFI